MSHYDYYINGMMHAESESRINAEVVNAFLDDGVNGDEYIMLIEASEGIKRCMKTGEVY